MIEISELDLLQCHERIRPHVHHTPVLTSRMVDKICGAQVYFKCENLQRTGSFKMRGATNAVLQLSDKQRSRGVVAHSSGNFAQAVALSAKNANVNAWIVMPENAPAVKVAAVQAYGGKVVTCESTIEARELAAKQVVAEHGASFLHPSNDLNVILGQGTAALEFHQQVDDLEMLFVPVGGGGLVAGCSLATHYQRSDCLMYGGEPSAADDAWRSLQSGKLETNETAETIADGLRTVLGDVNFPIIQRYVHEIFRVEEAGIIQAMRLIWERMKIVCEPSSAVPLAAIMANPDLVRGKRVGIVVSGGNVDLSNLPFTA